jgi:hypothetical protein
MAKNKMTPASPSILNGQMSMPSGDWSVSVNVAVALCEFYCLTTSSKHGANFRFNRSISPIPTK